MQHWIALASLTAVVVVRSLSCADFKLRQSTKISYADLQTMPDEDILSCLFILGRDPLGDSEGTHIWDIIIKMRGGASEVTDADLRQLGWVLRAVPEADIANFTLNEPDTIAALGHYRNLSEQQVLAERVSEDWANKEPSQYTNYDLTAMQHILCGFNRSSLESIHSDSYKDAATSLSTIRGCSTDALQALATLAQAGDAFGPPQGWISSQLKHIGCIINGLDAQALALIPAIAFESITPEIVACISLETMRVLSAGQLSSLTPSTVAAMLPNQRAVLSTYQHKAVANVYESIKAKSAASDYNSRNLACFMITFLFNAFKSI